MELSDRERRWARIWAAAFFPDSASWPPVADTLDDSFWARFLSSAPELLVAGFRAALLLATLFRLGRDEQTVLARWSHSRVYLVRQLVLVLRLVFSFAYFGDRAVRERVT